MGDDRHSSEDEHARRQGDTSQEEGARSEDSPLTRTELTAALSDFTKEFDARLNRAVSTRIDRLKKSLDAERQERQPDPEAETQDESAPTGKESLELKRLRKDFKELQASHEETVASQAAAVEAAKEREIESELRGLIAKSKIASAYQDDAYTIFRKDLSRDESGNLVYARGDDVTLASKVIETRRAETPWMQEASRKEGNGATQKSTDESGKDGQYSEKLSDEDNLAKAFAAGQE